MASHFGEKPCFLQGSKLAAVVKVKIAARTVLLGTALLVGTMACQGDTSSDEVPASSSPNIILLMSDDQGWGDVAYNGNIVVQTPHLDAMAAAGVRLDRFYAASPVCSPTRASVLTGRHPFRYGIEWAGEGHLPRDEITIAEALKANGYRTGHFGKWHVGELSRTINQSYFPGETADPEHYSPPWENGFDVSFSTESMMPTYNPYYHVGGNYGTEDYRFLQTEAVEENQTTGGFRWRDHFWVGPGEIEDAWLGGDSSRIIMDRAVEFIKESDSHERPFLAVIWFHTPHTPVVASNDDRALYPDESIEAQHWYGSITAMDRQIGRLRSQLRELGIAENTVLWFNSDNGPSYIHDFNSAGPFKGKKAELTEGGVRVPAIVEWPASLAGGRATDIPVSTSDIYPTLLAAAGLVLPEAQPDLDGINVLPLLSGEVEQRNAPIAFQSPIRGSDYSADRSQLQYALSDEQYKLFSGDGGASWELYDLLNDPSEEHDVAASHTERVEGMKVQLEAWIESTRLDAKSANPGS
jgi:arylsulfatase A-like enzyme